MEARTTMGAGDSATRPEIESGQLPTVLVCHPQAETYRRLLAERLPGVGVEVMPRASASCPDTRILLTWRPPAGVLARMPSLTWLHAAGAGVDHLLAREDLADAVAVTRSVGRFGAQAAEYVVGYLLHLLLDVEAYRRDQDRAVWRPRSRRLLEDLVVAVIGLGSVGGAIAGRLAALGADVVGACRTSRPARGVRRVYTGDSWRDMLPGCQVLVLAAPLTDATRGMLDADALARLPAGAVLVNVARGELVQGEALLGALRSGRLGAAVLDAFAREPLPEESPLWTEPRAWITPHVAAPSEPDRIADEFAHNYRRFVDGLPLERQVQRDRGY